MWEKSSRADRDVRGRQPGASRGLAWSGPAGLAALALAALFALTREERAPRTYGVGDPEALGAAYDSWVQRYASYGDGRDLLVLGLSSVKGLSAQPTRAGGGIWIDLEDGLLEARLRDLPADGGYELWLVDQRDAAGEASPGLQRVSVLAARDGAARVETRLDLEELEGFDLDLAVVVPAGGDPLRDGLLHGMPSLFQRLYHEGRGAAFGPRDDRPAEPPAALAAALGPFAPAPRPAPDSLGAMVALGETLFFEETFLGNGRTCGTCHPANNNFTLDPDFIASLPADDPLFVAENVPALAELENPKQMRTLALILENVDGFDKRGVLRSVPHTLALSTSLTPAPGGIDGSTIPPLERTGWSGDGSPGGGTLREFAIGAITQHLPQTLARVPGVDFREPTEVELDALEAFQLSLGRQSDPDLGAISLKSPIAERGRELFLMEVTTPGNQAAGKCTSCHNNGGANASPTFLAANGFPAGVFNLNLNIGTSSLPESLAEIVDPGKVPVDAGFGRGAHPDGGFGDHAFNVPTLIEAPDTAPYFHDNSALTLENAITFYLGGTFNGSEAADMLAMVDDPPGFGVMNLDDVGVMAISSFLRVMNSLQNIRSAKAHMRRLKDGAVQGDAVTRERVFQAALKDLDDARAVLGAIHLHPDAARRLRRAWNTLQGSGGQAFAQIDRAIQLAGEVPPMLVN